MWNVCQIHNMRKSLVWEVYTLLGASNFVFEKQQTSRIMRLSKFSDFLSRPHVLTDIFIDLFLPKTKTGDVS